MDFDFEGFEITLPSFNGFENGIGTGTLLSNNPLTSTWNRIDILNNEDSRNSTEISDEISDENMSIGSNSSVNSADIPDVSEPSIEEPIYQQISSVTSNSSFEDLNNSYSLVITQQKSVVPIMILSKETTSKGRDKFVLEPYGFEYVKGYDSYSKVGGVKVKNHTFLYFRCKNHQKKDIKCKAKLRVPYDYANSDPKDWVLYDKKITEPAGKDGGHSANCKHQPGKLIGDQLLAACKAEGLKQPLKDAKSILDELREQMVPVNTPTDFFPSDENIIKQINHYRKNQRIRPPHNMEELLLHEVKECAPGFTDFYRGDVKIRNRRHFIFFTDAQRRRLRQVKHVKMDGTFKIMTLPMYQLFTIHGYDYASNGEQQNVPLCFIAMSGKRSCDYAAVLGELKNLLEADGHQIKLNNVLIDFEASIWRGIEQVFGDSVKIRGCWFHYCQSIYRKIKKEKLENDFLRKNKVYYLGKELMCLALLEHEYAAEIFEHMKQVYHREIAADQGIENLFLYFERYWILGFFAPIKWNCYGKKCRTTNELENWNGKIWKDGGQKKHNLYSLAVVLQKNAIKCLSSLNYAKSCYTKKAILDKNKMINNIYKWYQKNSEKKYLALKKLAFGVSKQLTYNSPSRPWISEEDDLADIESLLELDE